MFKPTAEGDVLALEGFETGVWAGAHPTDPDKLMSRPIPEVVVKRLTG